LTDQHDNLAAGTHVLVGVTGSIAAFKAADLVSRLTRGGYGVTVVMTTAAQKFVGSQTFRALSHNRVITDLFIEESEFNPLHISLAERASAIVIAPATANVIGKIAGGIADDALTCIVMAATVPIVIAPAMNDVMYANPIVQSNVRKLTDLGYRFVGPVEGRLASGKAGLGRLAPIDTIGEAVEAALSEA